VKAKALLNSGKAHFTSLGKWKEEGKMRPPCKDTCKQCEDRAGITEETRKAEFSTFWGLGEKRSQWDFLPRRVKLREPQRKTAGTKRRISTLTYLNVGERKRKYERR